jgi:hypothetical protein
VSLCWRPLRSSWPAVADRLGFKQSRDGRFIRRNLELSPEGGWLVLKSRDPLAGDPLQTRLTTPGPWRGLRDDDRWVLGCDIPLLSDDSQENSQENSQESESPDDALASIDSLITWAEITEDGRLPIALQPPTGRELDEWVPAARRSLRAGSLVREIEVVGSPTRLTLCVPNLVRVHDDLSQPRRKWIHELCRDAQQRWRMVRFGIDERAAVRAEVDLSGAPSDVCEALVELGLAALTTAAVWALPGLAAAADTHIESRLLDPTPGPHASKLTILKAH